MPAHGLRFALLLTFVLSSLPAVSAGEPPGRDRYFVLIFGSQPAHKDPHRCHTWGTIVKASEANGVTRLESHTISWVPADLRIKVIAIASKPGMNLDLMTTIRRYMDMNGKVSVWGPYELAADIGPDLYARTLQQIARLESGQIRYMAVDPDFGPRVRTVSDCIHAITDIDQQQGRTFYSELLRYGDAASAYIVKVLTARGRIDPCVRHEWVLGGLGLADVGLTRR